VEALRTGLDARREGGIATLSSLHRIRLFPIVHAYVPINVTVAADATEGKQQQQQQQQQQDEQERAASSMAGRTGKKRKREGGKTRGEENERDDGGRLALARLAVELTGVARVVARFDAVSWAFGEEGIELSDVEKRVEELTRRLDAVEAAEDEAVAEVKGQLEKECLSVRREWEEKCEAAIADGIDSEVYRELGHDMCSGVCGEE
jgi:hypothetical protein